ncbi:AraC family transcriptional regulator [Paenibacillus soyae]|uniref:AraC family transcriptional regulator n=1 Tax=Paenibacillus soyae TaxID=2969249 RepID=A0A9X2MV28_9BACL|nr:AraC family transcriptional regulator [Paenibacillus soyae]MCR2806403.1 AraC family transcriptional regulator [Paenibacillus soyae]
MADQGVAISMVYPIMKSLVQKGLDPAEFFEAAGFDARLLQDVEARIPGEELERLMKAAAAYSGDEHFGLHQGQMTDFADLGILGYVMMHSHTVRDALKAYQKYNDILCSGFNLDWKTEGNMLLLRLFMQHPGRMSRHCVEDMAGSVYRMIGRISNRSIPLWGIRFEHDQPADTAPYEASFGTIPAFGETANALCMNAEVLDYPILYSDPRLLAAFEAIAQETMDSLSDSAGFSVQVMRWMKNNMVTNFPTLQQTAESFGTSARTLQLKLKEENTTFHSLTAAVRKELAIGYLKRREYSIGDIAYALHFSEPSAFQSAFKKWTGMTPGQYRTQAREGKLSPARWEPNKKAFN